MRPMSLTAAALAVIAFASAADARTWNQSWTVEGRPTVQVYTNDAHVHVHRGQAGTVSANVVYEAHTWGWRTGVHEPEVSLSREGNTISVSARARGTWVMFGGVSERFHVDVTVPGDCDLEVRSGDGAVDCEPVSGHVNLQTSDGHLRATGLHGDLILRSGDGGIDAADLDGKLLARSGDGHMRITGRFDALDVHAGDGSVEVTATRGSKLDDEWNAQTGDGGLTLLIPHDLRALLDAHTGDGHLHVDLPISVRGDLSGHDLRGQLNGGTMPLRLRTSDGSIRLGLSE